MLEDSQYAREEISENLTHYRIRGKCRLRLGSGGQRVEANHVLDVEENCRHFVG